MCNNFWQLIPLCSFNKAFTWVIAKKEFFKAVPFNVKLCVWVNKMWCLLPAAASTATNFPPSSLQQKGSRAYTTVKIPVPYMRPQPSVADD